MSAIIDGTQYLLTGWADTVNVTLATLNSVEFTATRTSFVLTAGPMVLNASFISPIEVGDAVRWVLERS